MSTLLECCDCGLTDKNTTHSYLEVYESLFKSKRETATHVLEVGIGPAPNNAGSIRMWALYFPNAQIHACDVIPIDQVHLCIVNHPQVYLHTSNDAYNSRFVQSAFSSKNIKFDILVDDGPHTLQSMVSFITLYLPLMKDDGVLVIEDIQDIAWTDTLHAATPIEWKMHSMVYDRRQIKGRYDDIMFVITKNK
jgi:hypothetical protein